ncbi:hypothetical protein BDV96DRAFT_694190 [Lophiotrema nucula]|uniref:Uncharacterized protein n=1 Tax=Lophiotrema nucula TaxID=690887 RepID=A0A6A5YJ42_9PLEO|nr:hypothetical protein BDV96DRAFT_694190 [Lophiotrema nucula]
MLLNEDETCSFFDEFPREQIRQLVHHLAATEVEIANGRRDGDKLLLRAVAFIFGKEKVVEYLNRQTEREDAEKLAKHPLSALQPSSSRLNVSRRDDERAVSRGPPNMTFTDVDYVAAELNPDHENSDLGYDATSTPAALLPPVIPPANSTTTTAKPTNKKKAVTVPDPQEDFDSLFTEIDDLIGEQTPLPPIIQAAQGSFEAPVQSRGPTEITLERQEEPGRDSASSLNDRPQRHEAESPSPDHDDTPSSRNPSAASSSVNLPAASSSRNLPAASSSRSKKRERQTSPLDTPRASVSPLRKKTRTRRVRVGKKRGDWQCGMCGYWWNDRFSPVCRRPEDWNGTIFYGCKGTRKNNCGDVHDHGEWREEPDVGDWYCGKCGKYTPGEGRHCDSCKKVRSDYEKAVYLGDGVIRVKDGSELKC